MELGQVAGERPPFRRATADLGVRRVSRARGGGLGRATTECKERGRERTMCMFDMEPLARFRGVLAPRARLRPRIVPKLPPNATTIRPPNGIDDALSAES